MFGTVLYVILSNIMYLMVQFVAMLLVSQFGLATEHLCAQYVGLP